MHLSQLFSELPLVVVLVTCCCVSCVECHGRLWEPPSRGSMWRRGYNTSVNINDNELSCGGFTNQWVTYGGRCGVCGDPYQQQPRENEYGGKFASGIISRVYPVGSQIDVVVGLTANHGGYFEFYLCPVTEPPTPVTLECMEKYPLQILDGVGGGRRFYIKDHTLEGDIKMAVVLPPDLYCKHCVLRWKYRTGSRWGCDVVNSCGKGQGPQEEFYGCSDIGIDYIKYTVFNDPDLRHNTSELFMGLNDLGSSGSNSGNRKSHHDPAQLPVTPARAAVYGARSIARRPNSGTKHRGNSLRDSSASYTKNGVRGYKIRARNSNVMSRNPIHRPVAAEFVAKGIKRTLIGDVTAPPVITDPSQTSQARLSFKTLTAIEQPLVDTILGSITTTPSYNSQTNVHAARRFLEDITFNAIVNYYGNGNQLSPDVKCKASLRYERNPIVQHYCGTTCAQDNFQCPPLLCTCSAEHQATTANTPASFGLGQEQAHQRQTTAPTQNMGHLKTFVSNLIDRNRLFADTAGGAGRDVGGSPGSNRGGVAIGNSRKRVGLPGPKLRTTVTTQRPLRSTPIPLPVKTTLPVSAPTPRPFRRKPSRNYPSIQKFSRMSLALTGTGSDVVRKNIGQPIESTETVIRQKAMQGVNPNPAYSKIQKQYFNIGEKNIPMPRQQTVQKNKSLLNISTMSSRSNIPKSSRASNVAKTGSVATITKTDNVPTITKTGSVSNVAKTGSVTNVPKTGSISKITKTGSVSNVAKTGSISNVAKTGISTNTVRSAGSPSFSSAKTKSPSNSVSLFNIKAGNNNDLFKAFITSTIQKTDIANTKLGSRPSSANTPAVSPKELICTAASDYAHNPYMTDWCMTNCPFGFCPPNVCVCNRPPI